MKYEAPKIEIVRFDSEDIITASGGNAAQSLKTTMETDGAKVNIFNWND